MILTAVFLALAQGGWDVHLEVLGTPSDRLLPRNWVGDLDLDGANDFCAEIDAYSRGLQFFSGAQGTPLFFIPESQITQQSVGLVLPFADVNSDGVPDFLIYSGSAAFVSAFSGRDGSPIWETEDPGTWFGYDVEVIPDWNGDGILDVAVGDFFEPPFQMPQYGEVHILSGRSGNYVHSFNTGITEERFGRDVESLGDLDGDQRVELVTRWPAPQLGYSDPTGKLAILWSNGSITSMFANSAPPRFGYGGSMESGDFNGDGLMDLAVQYGDTVALRQGIAILAGPDFDLVQVIESGQDRWYGTSLTRAHDFDGDVADELLIPTGYIAGQAFPRHLDLRSGLTGTLLTQFYSPGPEYGDPAGGAWAGEDASGDGRPDLLLSFPLYSDPVTGQYLGAIRVLAGPRFLHLDVSVLQAGQTADADVTLADPQATIWLLASYQAGLTTIPTGEQFNLAPPLRILATGSADPNGAWLEQGVIPPATPVGTRVYFQALSFDNSGRLLPSNLVLRVVQ